MLTLTIANKLETQQLTHSSGPLEFGRGPARPGAARVVVKDAFVSRDHIRVEEVPGRKVKVTNLSTKATVTVDGHAVLNPGVDCDYLLPVRLAVGETVVDVDSGDAEPMSVNALRTIAAPRSGTSGGKTVVAPPPLIERNEAAKPEEIVEWLETVVNVQKAGDREAFYKQAADALVEKIGLDTGIVLVKEGEAWRVTAHVTRDDQSWRSVDGTVQLSYLVMEKNSEDSNGVMIIEVSAKRLEAGKPATFEVTGSAAGSQRWFGIYLLPPD